MAACRPATPAGKPERWKHMKRNAVKLVVLSLAAALTLSFATPALAYSQWPNPNWDQKTFGVIKRGERNTGKVLLVQWHCYAAQAKAGNGQVMKRTNVDGILGARSVQYVKSYQQKKGLKADGKIGNATYRKMMATMSSTSDPSTGNVIYNTNDVIRVEKTSRHKKTGNWFTYNRNNRNVRIK
jgi:peptidoglycan hydrolase-like protein with peptidoglycan-binding domain